MIFPVSLGPVARCFPPPLSNAIKDKEVDIFRMILDHPDVDVNARKDLRFKTPLMFAAPAGEPEMVRELLARQEVDLSLRDRFGNTALIIAQGQVYDYSLQGQSTELQKAKECLKLIEEKM